MVPFRCLRNFKVRSCGPSSRAISRDVVVVPPRVHVARGLQDDGGGLVHAVDGEADFGVLVVGGRQEVDPVGARGLDVHCVVQPFSRFRPTHVVPVGLENLAVGELVV